MQLTDQALKEFEKIWLSEHPQQKLDKTQLLEMATRVINLVKVIYKPIKK